MFTKFEAVLSTVYHVTMFVALPALVIASMYAFQTNSL